MVAGEGEISVLLMIKKHRVPLVSVVALVALLVKAPQMNVVVGVAALALFCRLLVRRTGIVASTAG